MVVPRLPQTRSPHAFGVRCGYQRRSGRIRCPVSPRAGPRHFKPTGCHGVQRWQSLAPQGAAPSPSASDPARRARPSACSPGQKINSARPSRESVLIAELPCAGLWNVPKQLRIHFPEGLRLRAALLEIRSPQIPLVCGVHEILRAILRPLQVGKVCAPPELDELVRRSGQHASRVLPALALPPLAPSSSSCGSPSSPAYSSSSRASSCLPRPLASSWPPPTSPPKPATSAISFP